MKHRYEFVVDDLACILQLPLAQLLGLQLQFVAGDVIPEHRTLCMAGTHSGQHPLSQVNVPVHHLKLVAQFAQFQVVPSQEKPHLLAVPLHVEPCHPLPLLCHAYSCREGTSGIDDLRDL